MFTGGCPWKIGTNNTSHHQGAPKVYSPAAQRSPYWFCFCIAFAQHLPGNPRPFGDPMRRLRKRNPAAPSSPHWRLAARHMGTKFWGFCGAKYLGTVTWLGCYLQLFPVTRGKFRQISKKKSITRHPNIAKSKEGFFCTLLCSSNPELWRKLLAMRRRLSRTARNGWQWAWSVLAKLILCDVWTWVSLFRPPESAKCQLSRLE